MITTITKNDLDLHVKWLNDEPGGVKLVSETGADLRGADLHGADLRGADLRGADLRGVDLYGADLSGVDLRSASLRGVNLRGADLRGAKGILSIGPGGSRGDMLYAVVGDGNCKPAISIEAGCFWGTLQEFVAAVQATHGDNQYGRYYRAVIAMVEEWADDLPKTEEAK